MTDAPLSRVEPGHVRPRLKPGIERRRTPDGRLVLVGQGPRDYTDVRSGEERLLELLDGSRCLDELITDALALSRPLRPLGFLGFLRRLFRAHLLEGVEGYEENLFGASGDHPLQLLARAMDVRLGFRGLRFLVAPGRLLPRSLWPVVHAAAALLLASGLIVAAADGQLGRLLSPFAATGQRLQVLALVYGGLACALSCRDIYRGLLLRSLGFRVPRCGVRVLFGIVHLCVDDRERRAARRSERLHFALAGLAALALVGGAATWAYLVWHTEVARYLASMAIVALVVDLAPYLRSDAHEVAGILTRIPGHRRRSMSFMLRRLGRRLVGATPLGSLHRRYLALTLAWAAHGALALHLMAEHLLPGALHMASEIVSGRGALAHELSPVMVVAGFALSLLLLLVLAVVLGGFAVVVLALLLRLITPRRRPGLRHREPWEGRVPEAFGVGARRIPFLASIGEEELRVLVRQMTRETFRPRQVVVRQGELGDRFCYIERGQCAVEVEEVSGRVHRVALLGPGDFFGEVALVRDVLRTATIRAIEPLELLSLERGAFQRLCDTLGVSRGQVLSDVRNSAFLRSLVLFARVEGDALRAILAALTELHVEAGAEIVSQDDPGDTLYVIREGSVTVERRQRGAPPRVLSRLSVGEVFGEVALFTDGRRVATVRAAEPTVVLAIPIGAFRDVLMRSFSTALLLDSVCSGRLDALESA